MTAPCGGAFTAPACGVGAADATARGAGAHRLEMLRARRITLLLIAMTLMGLSDLLCTLAYMRMSGMVEMNPLARWVANEGGASGLVAFKLSTIGVSAGILFALRRRPIAERCAWIGAAAMLALTAHWVHFNAHVPGMTTLMHELAAASPPEWVRLRD
ncbi:MAG: hypothetical protein IBJ10_05895 [Phycisphaerales bacterium]|nr:hypothetical protein [Phycisphaerales bacterium]